MTLTYPITEGISRVVRDARVAGRALNVRAEAALLRLEYPAEQCVIEEIADALEMELAGRPSSMDAVPETVSQQSVSALTEI